MNKQITLGMAAFVALAVAGGIMLTDIGQKSDSQGLMIGKNTLNIDEQKTGLSAVASLVILEEKGYVAIHETAGENPANIIGASALLNAGKSTNVEIILFESLKEGKTYIAMLHKDNGDGIFDGADLPVLDETGAILMMRFQANPLAESGAESNI